MDLHSQRIWFINRIFPDHLLQNKYLVLLFSVLPGFYQQWISVIYSHAFLIFALYFFSFSLFIDQINKENYKWTKSILPILLSMLCLLATEYMTGMEVLRPFIIYKIVSRKNPRSPTIEKMKTSFMLWVPYLSAVLLFLVYRVFIASSVLYKVQKLDNISNNPLSTIFNLVQVQLLNIYTSTILAWGQIIQPWANLDPSSLFTIIYLSITVCVFLITYFFINRQKKTCLQNNIEIKKWGLDLFSAAL